MNNTIIQNCNNELLDKQKENLIYEIINGQNSTHFKIFDIEAGCRKTRTAEIALAQMVKTTNKNAIFVRLFNKDCIESEDIINRLVGKNIAFAYNNETVSQNAITKTQKDFPKYRILILTHQKYIRLAQDKRKRNIFTKDRSILVIDEFVHDVKKLSVNKKDINTFKLLFAGDIEISKLYLKLVSMIEDFLTTNSNCRCFGRITNESLSKNVNLLQRYIRNNLSEDMLKYQIASIMSYNLDDDFNVDLLQKMTTAKQVCDYVEDLKEFYKQVCIVENGTLYTTDSKCKHWLLENNIMLDASGELQIAYNMNEELYQLEKHEKVLDHSNWTIVNIVVNSTSSGKEKICNFYEEVNKVINHYGTHDTLVIGNKSDIVHIDVIDDHKGYYGNLTGSNKWASLSNVVVMQTPNINDVDYILQYIHYSKEYIDVAHAKWTGKSSGRNTKARYEFSDKRFERIRTLWIAEQTYQAIKRVNRNMNHVTNAVIFMNNPDVIELLKSYLKGSNLQVIEESMFEFQRTKQDEYIEEIQKNSHAQKFMDLLAEIINGKHVELTYKNKDGNIINGTFEKKSIREYLKIKNPKDFNNKVLSKTHVISYCNTREIDLSGKFIRVK